MRGKRVPLRKTDFHTIKMAAFRLRQIENNLTGEIYQHVVGARLSLEFGLEEVEATKEDKSGSSDR